MAIECWPFKEDVILFDLETTSVVVDEARIVEIGAIKCMGYSGLVCGKFHEYIDPGMPIPPSASRVNKITDEMVVGKSSVDTILPQFFEWGGNSVYTAYNLPYDDGVINAELDRYNLWPKVKPLWRFDMRTFAHRLINPNDIFNYKLTEIAKFHGIIVDNAHTAIGDVEIMHKILIKFITLWNELGKGVNVQDFKDWMCTDYLLEYWPFGRYKGRKCRDLPITFLQWALNEMVGDALHTVKYWMESHDKNNYG